MVTCLRASGCVTHEQASAHLAEAQVARNAVRKAHVVTHAEQVTGALFESQPRAAARLRRWRRHVRGRHVRARCRRRRWRFLIAVVDHYHLIHTLAFARAVHGGAWGAVWGAGRFRTTSRRTCVSQRGGALFVRGRASWQPPPCSLRAAARCTCSLRARCNGAPSAPQVRRWKQRRRGSRRRHGGYHARPRSLLQHRRGMRGACASADSRSLTR